MAAVASTPPQFGPVLCLGVEGEGERVATAGGTGELVSDAGITLWRLEADR